MALLDGFNRRFAEAIQSPVFSVGAGLMSQPRNIGRGLIAGMQNYQALQKASEERNLRRAQAERARAEAEAEAAAAAEAKRQQDLIQGLLSPAPPPDPLADPTQAAAAQQPAPLTAGGFGQALLRGGLDPLAAQRAQGVAFPGSEKTFTGADGKVYQILPGGEVRPVEGITPFQPPITVDVGTGTQVLSPYDVTRPTAFLPRELSPGQRQTAATAQARIAAEKANIERTAEIAKEKFLFTEAEKAEKATAKKNAEIAEAFTLITEAKEAAKEATGSLAGAAADKVASWFGVATPGATASAKLSTLGSNLIMAAPKLDTRLNEGELKIMIEASGVIADPTVPVGVKLEAIETVQGIMLRNEGAMDLLKGEIAKSKAGTAKPAGRTSSYQEFLRQRGRQ